MMIASPNVLGRTTSLRRLEDRLEPLAQIEQPAALVLRLGQPAHAVLDDDHGAVDDEAEVDRAEAHQVAADARAAPCR